MRVDFSKEGKCDILIYCATRRQSPAFWTCFLQMRDNWLLAPNRGDTTPVASNVIYHEIAQSLKSCQNTSFDLVSFCNGEFNRLKLHPVKGVHLF